MTKELYDDYINHNFYLGELDRRSKKPKSSRIKNGSCKHETSASSVKFSEDTWYFCVPPSNIIIIDVDVKNGKHGKESYLKLLDDLGYEEWEIEPSVQTGSGGFHVYAYCNKAVKSIQKNYPDIDFQSKNINPDKCPKYAVAGGQTIRYKNTDYVYKMLTDKIVINTMTGLDDLLEEQELHDNTHNEAVGFNNLDDENDDAVLKPDAKTPDEVRQLLQYCDASVPYDGGWMQTCSAIQRELGKTEEAYEIFREWSATGDNYDEQACINKWETVGSAENGWTIGSIIKNAREGKIKQYEQRIDNAQSFEEIEKLFESPEWSEYPTIPKDDIEPLAVFVKNKYKDLTGSTLNIQRARKLVKPVSKVESSSLSNEDWLNDIVYVESFSSSKFYIISTAERLSADGANGRFSSELRAYKQKNNIKTQVTFQALLKWGLIKVCSSHEYNPITEENIFLNDSGGITLNLFRANSTPAPAEEYTEYGKQLVDKFVAHLFNLMSDTEANVLLDWLAYITQQFGSKVLWTPLIQSAEGLGKSLIGNLMINHVFGRTNAGTVDSNVIVSQQTSWATTGVFKVLEEIKLAGHNRYEVLNQLKPFITNHTVSRVEKYEASVEVKNFTNFIAFTNFKDAIPVSSDDRRWWVVFSKLNSIDELEEKVGINRFDYFEPLHELVRPNSKYGCEFHKYLLERDISNFNPNFPPESIHKDRMRATEDDKTNYLSEFEDLIKRGGKGVTTEILSTKQLKQLMQTDIWEDSVLNDREIGLLLRKLNFIKFPKKTKYQGELHRIWFKNAGLTDDEIKKAFRESMNKEEIDDGFDNLDDF